MSSIESGAFSGLTSLWDLALSQNQLSSIESGDFSGMTNLTGLALGYNQLSNIESGDFSGLTNLTRLSLYGNHLSSIESGAFSGMPKLNRLHPDDNELSNVESGAFDGLGELAELHLSNSIALTNLNLDNCDFRNLELFDVRGEASVARVSLKNTTMNQASITALMDGGRWWISGIGDLNATEMDLSGVDFADITDLEPLYVMDDLTDLWLVDTQNLDASDLDLLLDSLETIEGGDTEGVLHMTLLNFIDFIVAGDGLLADWHAEPGHHVEYLLLGDVNHDTEVNGLDVDPFVDVLLASRFDVAADMNGDGVVNGLDVDPFVEAVVAGGAQAVPEPSTLLLCIALGVVGGWRKWKRAA